MKQVEEEGNDEEGEIGEEIDAECSDESGPVIEASSASDDTLSLLTDGSSDTAEPTCSTSTSMSLHITVMHMHLYSCIFMCVYVYSSSSDDRAYSRMSCPFMYIHVLLMAFYNKEPPWQRSDIG